MLEPSAATVEEIREAEIERALWRASDLGQYTDEQLASVSRWVVHVKDGVAGDALARQLDVPSVTPSGSLADTYFYDMPADLPVSGTVTKVQGIDAVENFYPIVPLSREPRPVPNDPYLGGQWHLINTGQTLGTPGEDANVAPAWDKVSGDGVVIGIVGDGLDWAHPDLAPHYRADLSWDFIDDDNDPAPPVDPEQGRLVNSHGTKVAGVAAAAGGNGIGITGAAYEAELAGIRLSGMTQDDSTVAAALSHDRQQIDIYNNSWGPADGLDWMVKPGPLTAAALADGIALGRGGLGNIFTWAAGDGLESEDNVNYDGYANSRYTIAVGAIDHNGVQTHYSEPGAPILVTAPSGSFDRELYDPDFHGILTTDISGEDGDNQSGTDEGYWFHSIFHPDPDPYPDIDYTEKFNGTSSSTPLVAGVVALMLEANPRLSYRDVQHILVESARKNDPADADWAVNGAGHDVNHKYGFGAVDASAAVDLAETWQNVRPEARLVYNTIAVNHGIADHIILEATMGIPDEIVLEWVEVTMNITHPFRADLKIELVSPDGTVSVLAGEHGQDNGVNYDNWTFTTARHWGESSAGDWKLRVIDEVTGDEGTWDDFTLGFFGTEVGTGYVRGTKFEDLDADGLQDGNERGQGGFLIYGDANDNGQLDPYEPTTWTAANGSYTLELTPGTEYTIREVPRAGWTPTSPASGGYTNISVADQQVRGGLDFGNDPDPFTVTGMIWEDLSADGLMDGFEVPMGGVEIYLDVDPGDGPDYVPGVDILTTSAPDGRYSFATGDVVGPGTYAVKQRVPPDFTQMFPADGGPHVVTAEPGGWVFQRDFGSFPDPLRLNSFTPTPSGFIAEFSDTIDTPKLNLYDVQAQTFGPPDVTLIGDTVGGLHGSLFADGDRLTFVATGGILPRDLYTVTLRSAANGFKYLDGDGDGNALGDYTTTFTVDPPISVVVSLPDFTRGPSQPVNVPVSATGLPLTLSDADSVSTVELTVHYNPALLTVTGATLGNDVPAAAEVTFNSAVPGEITIGFSSPQDLDPGPAEIVVLSAEVPSSAPYAAAHVLDITTVSINGGFLPALSDDAIHVAAYFGDATGNGNYSGLDAQRVGRVFAQLDTGFEAYPVVDPVVVGGVTRNGGLSGLDARQIALETIGLAPPEIPPLPQPQRLNEIPAIADESKALDNEEEAIPTDVASAARRWTGSSPRSGDRSYGRNTEVILPAFLSHSHAAGHGWFIAVDEGRRTKDETESATPHSAFRIPASAFEDLGPTLGFDDDYTDIASDSPFRDWLTSGLSRELTAVFRLDFLGFAVMSNHVHGGLAHASGCGRNLVG